MITKSNQSWEVGQTVKVGFLSDLVVMAKVATPGDQAPDAYILRRNVQLYKFVPHFGLEKITADEARDLMAKAKAHAERCAAAALAKASTTARQIGEINNLFA